MIRTIVKEKNQFAYGMLCDYKRGQILAYSNIGISIQRISNKYKRSKTTLFNFLQNSTIYITTKSAGRPNNSWKRTPELDISQD